MGYSLIDYLIALFSIIIGGFISVAGFGFFLLIRAFIRYVLGNDDDTLNKTSPRVRTHIKNSPIEADIAKAVAREFPGRNPAQFI